MMPMLVAKRGVTPATRVLRCSPNPPSWPEAQRLLAADGRPYDAEMLARVTGASVYNVTTTIAWLSDACVVDPTQYPARLFHLGEFVKARCTTGPQSWALSAELFKAYCAWSPANGEPPLGRSGFHTGMLSLGYEYSRSRRVNEVQQRTFEGLALVVNQ